MSTRLKEELRRKRERRLARERAYREWVCDGPLVEHDKPIMQGVPGDEAYEVEVRAELESRARRMAVETHMLILAFTRGCAVRPSYMPLMETDLFILLNALPGPWVHATHSTHPGVRTTTATTIPRF